MGLFLNAIVAFELNKFVASQKNIILHQSKVKENEQLKQVIYGVQQKNIFLVNSTLYGDLNQFYVVHDDSKLFSRNW